MTFRNSPPAGSRPSSASRSSLHLVVLAAREGWHTRELTRALEARGHTGAIVPYEGLVASIGRRSGGFCKEAEVMAVVAPKMNGSGSGAGSPR